MAGNKKITTEKQMTNSVPPKKSFFQSLAGWFNGLGRKKWLLLVLMAVAAGGLLILNNIRQNQQKALAALETVAVEKGNLVAIVGATGTVNANQSADLVWQTNGRIASVNVKLNEKVKEGQVLAVLDPTSVSPSINTARADLVSARRALQDVLESRTAEAEAYLALLRAEEEYEGAKDDRDQWNYKDASWDSVAEYRTTFLDAESDLHKAEAVVDELAANPSAVENDLLKAQEQLAEAQTSRNQALRNLTNLLGKNYDQTVAEDFAKYDLAEAKMQDARRNWERVKKAPTSEDIEAAQARVDAAESTVALASISAPFSGTVTVASVKAGDEVKAGMSSFRVDDLSKLVITVEVPEVDINSIKVGQSATLSFDAIFGKEFKGTVTEVQPVGTITQGVVNFAISIELEKNSGEVKPGMTAAVSIVVSEVNDVLIVPNRAIRRENGSYIVYVMRDGVASKVTVEIGASSDTSTQILSGDVAEGDLVILNPPFEIPTNAGMPSFVRR